MKTTSAVTLIKEVDNKRETHQESLFSIVCSCSPLLEPIVNAELCFEGGLQFVGEVYAFFFCYFV